MSGTVATNFFTGWLGVGTAVSAGQLQEPADPSYARRTISYGPLAGSYARDTGAGSIGPSGLAWNYLAYVGLFAAASGGTPLATWSLSRPVFVPAGGTFTTAGQFGLTLSSLAGQPSGNALWLAGTMLGLADSGSIVTAWQNLQLASGALSAVGTSATPTGVTGLPPIGSLPTAAPAAGSGLYWNNGGVICIA